MSSSSSNGSSTVYCRVYAFVRISFLTYYTQTLQTILCCISMSYDVPMQPTPLGGAVATSVEPAGSAASGGGGGGHTVGGVGVIVVGATRAILV